MTNGAYPAYPPSHEPVEKVRDQSTGEIDLWCEACRDWVPPDPRSRLKPVEAPTDPDQVARANRLKYKEIQDQS